MHRKMKNGCVLENIAFYACVFLVGSLLGVFRHGSPYVGLFFPVGFLLWYFLCRSMPTFSITKTKIKTM